MDNKTSPEQKVNENTPSDGTPLGSANGHDRDEAVSREIEQLSRLTVAKYGVIRKETAKRLGMTVSELDKTVKRAKNKRASEEDGFERDDNGLIKNEANMLRAFELLGINISFNEFTGKFKIDGLPGFGPDLDDGALDDLYLTVEREYGLKLTDRDFTRIVEVEGRRQRYHPVKEYLSSLEWDRVERIDGWLNKYFGAKDTALNCAIGRLTLVAAVRRIMQPGCKFDTMLVLEGPQGAGKSRGVRALCPDATWFSDCVTLHNTIKEVMELTTGKWIVEIGELAGMKKAAAESLKSMLSRQNDESRRSYGRYREENLRQSIFIGTTNEENYLIDDTGNRRFLTVRTTDIDVAAIARDRDQLWAEAAYYEAQNEAIHLKKELHDAATEAQRERELRDEWEEPIVKYLAEERKDAFGNPDNRVTVLMVAQMSELVLEKVRIDSVVQKRIARCMKRVGWNMTHQSNGKRYWTHPKVEDFRIWAKEAFDLQH